MKEIGKGRIGEKDEVERGGRRRKGEEGRLKVTLITNNIQFISYYKI